MAKCLHFNEERKSDAELMRKLNAVADHEHLPPLNLARSIMTKALDRIIKDNQIKLPDTQLANAG